MLTGKTALITGASKGIGSEIAKLFTSNGANLILISRNEDQIKTLISSIKEINPNTDVIYYVADISDAEKVKAVFNLIQNSKKEIDILVNNAGVMVDGMLMMMSTDSIRKNLDINLFGTICISQAVIKFMIKKRGGSIINLTSIVGIQGSAGQSVYSASKSGIIGFTKSLSKELAPLQIRVNAIAPGFIETALTENLATEIKDKTLKNIGMKRLGIPEDVAKVALFLASDLSGYVTGQTIGVDGGMVI